MLYQSPFLVNCEDSRLLGNGRLFCVDVRYGVLPWERLFAPSVQLARNGWKINRRLASSIQGSAADLLADPALKTIFAPYGTLLKEGDLIKRSIFADTLEEIGKKGVDVFYNGRIAVQLIKTITERGGIMTFQDLSSYKPIFEVPLLGTYRGATIVTAPPPASGAVLLSLLNILEHYDGLNLNDPLDSHRMVEAFKHGYSQRGYYGDPSDPIYRNISEITRYFTQKITSDYVAKRIDDSKTFPTAYYEPVFDVLENHGTMHISILTADGEAVALTSTVNLSFGSKIMDPFTGIFLNDEMDDFSIPGVSNGFGLAPSPYNYIHPGKRPLSSSVPTIVIQNKKPVIVTGASGGSQIITATLQSIVRMLDMDLDPHTAIHSPRLHHQLLPESAFVEATASEAVIKGLESKGHKVLVGNNYIFTGVSAVKRTSSGLLQGSGDERKGGASRAY